MIHLYFKKSILINGWEGDKNGSEKADEEAVSGLDRAGGGFHYGNGSKD